MKKTISLLLFLFITIGCSELLNEKHTSSNCLTDKLVLNTETDKCSFNVSIDDIYTYLNKTRPNTKTNEEVTITPIRSEADTLAYLLAFKEGWFLLAADKRLSPIIAFDKEGRFTELNSGVKTLLSFELEKIEALKKGIVTIPEQSMEVLKNIAFWNKITGTSLPTTKADGDPEEDDKYWELIDMEEIDSYEETSGHLIQTRWHQEFPWNTFSPAWDSTANSDLHDAAGCTAVAAAQLLYYLHSKIGVPSSAPTNGYCTGYSTNLTDTAHFQQCFYDFSSTAWGGWRFMIRII